MDLRPTCSFVRSTSFVARSFDCGYSGESENAGWSRLLRAEARRQGGQVVQMPQVPHHDGEPQRFDRIGSG